MLFLTTRPVWLAALFLIGPTTLFAVVAPLLVSVPSEALAAVLSDFTSAAQGP